MIEVEIKKDQFLEDRDNMTVTGIMEKYNINTTQYYKILDQLGIKRNKMGERKSFKVV